MKAKRISGAALRKCLSPQNTMLLQHFQTFKRITPMSALVNYGIARLASRIQELRAVGAPIATRMKVVNGKKYAEYVWQG